MDAWPNSPNAAGEPWESFIKARELIAKGRTAEAVAVWRGIAEMEGIESRHIAQAWCFLRATGVAPGRAEGKRLLGVVVEVSIEGGVDLLAAYPDGTARYWNHGGGGVVWERADDSMEPLVQSLLSAGQRILDVIGPWEEARPAAPTGGMVRLNMLSPSGLHFGQASFPVLRADPMARPVVDAALALMQGLIAKQAGG